MAKYSDIKGFTVQTVSTDPAASVADSGSWSSVSGLNTGRSQVDGCGIITAALATGGYTTTNVANTESWDGSTWSEVNDLNAATRDKAVIGTYTAAVAAGGNPPSANNESWNGSSWTEVNNLNTARGGGKGVGTNTAGLMFGGYGTARSALNESWDGTNWTEVGDMNTARASLSGAGTQTAALAFNGGPNANIGANAKDTESWNGSSWTTLSSSSNTNIEAEGAGSCGTQTDALLFGGSIYDSSGPSARTEAWNGSTWTEVGGDLATGRSIGADSGTGSTSAMLAGGSSGTTATEQWTTSFTPTTLVKITEGQLFFNSTANAFKETISDVPGAAWASITASNTPRFGLGGAGTQTEALIFSGAGGSPTANRPQTEHWNGSSWTELNDLNLGRYHSAKTSFGTVYTAALAATGYTYVSPAQNIANVESWDGTSWTEVNDVNSARRGAGAGGTSTSGIIGGGYTTTITNLAETWNGSSWTEVSELNTGREDTGGVGTSNSDMQMHGGYTGSQSGATEQWNGSSWTEVNDMNTARSGAAGSGTPSLAIAVGGEPGNSAKTEFWNGSSWTEVGDLGTARTKSGSSATSALASILVAGSAPPFSAAAEEWTVNLANKTITSS